MNIDIQDLRKALTSLDAVEQYVEGLEKDLKDCQAELDNTKDEVKELELRVEELENREEYEKVLEIYADSSNWNGTHFAPLLRYQQTSEPWEYADRVLKI